ncbi:tigger transposable element-derived protein 6-like [Tetranychus urticae]|uniref:tigger transposable element-derived protein 6-like n=1 Tax=Tetranychus urticae TaxID=32264 RepID=UPI00077C0096|nr:tigger transposable element-derived protein 6-like [Tetranychus urticae]
MPRRNLNVKEKENLINKLNNGLCYNDVKQEFKVSVATVFRCKQNSESIREAITRGLGNRSRLVKDENIINHDNLVKEFINRCSDIGLPLSAKLIRQKAVEIARSIGRDDLKCSHQWFLRFRERAKVKKGTISGEKKSIDNELVDQWKKIEIPRILINWQDEFIFKCDETGLFWRQLPIKTYFISKTEHGGDKIFKERVSILFCVCKNGFKMKPLIIGRSVKPRCFHSGCFENLNVDYIAQENAWMNRNIFEKWLTDWHNKLILDNKKVLLILDNFSGHNINFNQFPMITFKFLPPSTTAMTQPLDGGIIHSFKAKYLNLFINYLLDNNVDQLSQFVKTINLLNAIKWIDEAWTSVQEETVKNCWSHFGYKRHSIDDNNCSNVTSDVDLSVNLNKLNYNCCSQEEFIEQITFEYFDD